TSPFALLGAGDAGGMNVYVRELSRNLVEQGVEVDVFTRRTDRHSAQIVELQPGLRLIQVEAGPPQPMPKDSLFCYLPDFASDMAYLSISEGRRYDVVHGHYWLSGWAGHLLQRYWDVPLVLMFHTLAHLKNAVSPEIHQETTLRLQVERRLIDLADGIITAN